MPSNAKNGTNFCINPIHRLFTLNWSRFSQREIPCDSALQANEKLREYNRAYYDSKHKRPSK